MNTLPSLIEADTLLHDTNWVPLDFRSPHEVYSGHIPDTVMTDYAKDGWRRAEGAAQGLLPDEAQLSALFSRLGLKQKDRIVLIGSGTDASSYAAGARLFWTMKMAGHREVALLDGGWQGWLDADGPVATGLPDVRPPSDYPVHYSDTERLRSPLDVVEKALAHGQSTFMDARPQAFFLGRAKAPTARYAGRLPGARSLDSVLLFDAHRARLKDKKSLEALVAQFSQKSLITYCNTGHTAALNWFVLTQVLGRNDVTLFDGSMTQWTEHPERPIEMG
jgi:thiosulfate/3-mercaptopyruvate sulfurtransferase